jgi:Ulp1 family protease
VFPEDKPVGHVVVTALDLRSLEDTEFVNDTIIDYYYKVVQQRYAIWKASGDTVANLHFFNSFFFKKLTEKGKHTRGMVRL